MILFIKCETCEQEIKVISQQKGIFISDFAIFAKVDLYSHICIPPSIQNTKDLEEIAGKIQKGIDITDNFGIKCYLDAPEMPRDSNGLRIQGKFFVYRKN